MSNLNEEERNDMFGQGLLDDLTLRDIYPDPDALVASRCVGGGRKKKKKKR
jgi:hypothetical protein